MTTNTQQCLWRGAHCDLALPDFKATECVIYHEVIILVWQKAQNVAGGQRKKKVENNQTASDKTETVRIPKGRGEGAEWNKIVDGNGLGRWVGAEKQDATEAPTFLEGTWGVW